MMLEASGASAGRSVTEGGPTGDLRAIWCAREPEQVVGGLRAAPAPRLSQPHRHSEFAIAWLMRDVTRHPAAFKFSPSTNTFGALRPNPVVSSRSSIMHAAGTPTVEIEILCTTADGHCRCLRCRTRQMGCGRAAHVSPELLASSRQIPHI